MNEQQKDDYGKESPWKNRGVCKEHGEWADYCAGCGVCNLCYPDSCPGAYPMGESPQICEGGRL